MAAAVTKPVILLAFANDPADGINYLRNLPEEARQVRAALAGAEAQGLCEFELLYNVTLDDILGAFQNPKYKGRIAVFHYGGHAESYELLFQSTEGNLQRIDGRGFAAFLAEQRSLQLVFLNACTTEPQVESLLAANVQVVIATSEEVDDTVAATLARAFYQHLAAGDSIGSAYRQAIAALRAAKGDDPSLFYLPGGGPAINLPPPTAAEPSTAPGTAPTGEPSAEQAVDQSAESSAQAASIPPTPTAESGGSASGGYWPWLLRTRRGAEAAVEWSLPLAAGDPLFGLPPLPPKPLPPSPYQRALEYYTRDMAELFFGRGPEIRDLYQRVTAANRSRVILYYGQSGVGKSSLLDAGLAPRLEATHLVSYARRDRTLGLLGTLRKQLASLAADGASAGGLSAASDISTAWAAAEAAAGRPIVFILDQVEELFTRRNPELPQELEEFVAALYSLDAPSSPSPAGVLLLGFRKERLAELETALRVESIDFAKVYLAPLGADGVEEILWGPTRSARLQAKYGITVEAGLPPAVAHDLTADPDSPVAPTLHILLRKLWTAATAEAASTPHLSVRLYEQLQRDGIALDDFLRQQIATLAKEQPDAVASGFLLDLWAQHTTDLRTAEQCDARELHAAYPHRADLDAVLQRSKELYVLADPTGDAASPLAAGNEGDDSTRLAHDTLAPLVRRLYDHSTLPGQQARRLLDSRIEIWQGDPQALLDDPSLALIERGLSGTRHLSPGEEDLLAKSREARASRRRTRQFLSAAAAAAVLLLLAMLGLTLRSQTAEQEANFRSTQVAIAAAATAAFNQAQATAIAASNETERQLRVVADLNTRLANERNANTAQLAALNEAQRLAELAEQQLTVDPVVSLHLALAALAPVTSSGAGGNPGQPLSTEAEYVLRQAVLTSRERKYMTATLTSAGEIAVRGNRIALGGPIPAVYDLELSPQEFPLPREFTNIGGLRWGHDGRLLGWNETSAWVVGGGEPLHFALGEQGVDVEMDAIQCAEWQPAQRWVAICTFNALFAWQPESGRVLTLTDELDTPDWPTFGRSAIWSPDGRRLAGLGAKLVLWDSRFPQLPAEVFYPPAEIGQPVTFAVWVPPKLEDAPEPAGAAPITNTLMDAAEDTLVAGWFVAGDSRLMLHRWQPGGQALQPISLEGAFSSMQVKVLPLPGNDEQLPRLLLWTAEGQVYLYTFEGRRLAAAEDVLPFLNGVVLSPDGARIAGYSASGAAIVWSVDDLGTQRRLEVAGGFTAGPLSYGGWLDNRTLALADRYGLFQVVSMEDTSTLLPFTRLYGYGPRDTVAYAQRLANGRLLTAGYGDGIPGSLRIWQLDPLPTAPGAGLPTPDDPLCRRVQRALVPPGGAGRPGVLAWHAGDELLTTDGTGRLAHWTVGGEAQVLPPDDDRYQIVVAPDGRRVLRYGDGTDGEIWRLDGQGWVLDRTLKGELTSAAWTDHGIVVGYADQSAAVIDPQADRTVALPVGISVAGAARPTAELLLAQHEGAVELWRPGGAPLASSRPLAAWPVPAGRRLQWDGAGGGRDSATDAPQLFAYRDAGFGQIYVLRLDAAAHTLTEVWRSEEVHVDRTPVALNPQLPLLATLNSGVVSLVDLTAGAVVWQSTSVAAVGGQLFRTVKWSTDGQYLITQSQPLREGSFVNSIAVWRWDADARRLILLQQMAGAELLGYRPDMTAVLAAVPGQPLADAAVFYPVLGDTARLRTDVEASCLLDRPLSADQQQAYMVGGR